MKNTSSHWRTFFKGDFSGPLMMLLNSRNCCKCKLSYGKSEVLWVNDSDGFKSGIRKHEHKIEDTSYQEKSNIAMVHLIV